MKTNFILSIICFALIFSITSCTDDTLSPNEFNLTENLEEEFTVDLKRSCGHDHHMEDLLQDATYRKQHEQKMIKVNQYLKSTSFQKASCANPPVIPVAVHYQGVSNPNQSCLRALAQNQVDILNADFSGTNSDINKWTGQASSSFPGVSNGETCVNFIIANKNHPSGFGLSDGDLAITFNQTNGDQNNKWSGYLNVYVQFNTGVLGYAPLGGSGNGDGVVIDASAFGAGSGCGSISPDAPYNLGRTTTHEVGHYLLLDHIWGGGCNQDDDVNDTPNSSSDYGGCPNIGASSCGSTDMHMNYMDYTNDACMYMFSAGQSTRMQGYINSSLSNLTNNATNVIDGAISGGGGDDDSDDGTNDDDTNDDDTNDDNDDHSGEEETDFCDKPTNTAVSNITVTSVKISWTSMTDALKYRVRYKAVGSTKWTGKTQNETSRNITGLSADVEYVYQVRTRCAAGWTGWTAKESFETLGDDTNDEEEENDGCTEITFELVLDDYGSETSWELVNGNGQTVATGGPYQDGQSGKKITKEFCLPDACYTMYVDDAYGDGICCDYGDGSFSILGSNGQVLAASNGNFGTYDYVDFCIDNTGFRKTGGAKDQKKNGLARKAKKF